MLLFLPENHRDYGMLRDWEGTEVLTEQASCPNIVSRTAVDRYTYRRAGGAVDQPPIVGILLEIEDEERFYENFTYHRYVTVPIFPLCLADIPSY